MRTCSPAGVFAATVALLLAADCGAQANSRRSDPSVMLPCPECWVIYFDDNRWQRIELSDVTGFKIGDRIPVHQNQIEPDDSDLP